MPEKREKLLEQLNTYSRDRRSLWQIITSLSLVVIVMVFWSLKLTGIGIAGEAFCGKDEHSHSDECLTKKLICTLEETESHQHSEICISKTLVCQREENAEHTHADTCWSFGKGFGCGLLEVDGHTHTAECLTEETELGCNKETTQGHTHTDECYKQLDVCPLEEHIHNESCYSDITADIETSDDWEQTLADIARGPTTKENVVLVAQSQLGYTESTLNFYVDAQGIRRGITRYGQWYGNPYGDWSAMFVSFCLEYAGATDLPMNAGPEAMRLEWEAADLYRSAGEALPGIGDLVFLCKDSESTNANAVAIITQVSEQMVTVIQGDLNDTVSETTYDITDLAILGYGLIPQTSSNEMLAEPVGENVLLAVATDYSTSLISNENQFVFYVENSAGTYAIDGNGNAVQVYISDDGRIYTDVADPNQLLWTISSYNSNSWAIQNVATGRYLHPFYNGSSDNGIITPGRWGTSINAAGTGVKFSHSAYVGLDLTNGRFRMTRTQGENVTFRVGISQGCTIWLDGTNGNLSFLAGSPNTAYATQAGSTIQLPETWTSPSRYSYKLQGWYDITNSRYYPAGSQMEVTGNAVLYADWVAATYDVGQFNAYVADTVSTNEFITTHLFDYNFLFNILSSRANATVSASDHSETWSVVTNGNVDYLNQPTLDFVFVDGSPNYQNGYLSYPNNRDDHNNYPGEGIVTSGIFNDARFHATFDPVDALGKKYLGTGDHLFQIMTDPDDAYYGYYYYDSHRNAASYNQSQGRFYVYEYLEAPSDSVGSTNSGFLPLNSPYANTNGNNVGTYTYNGENGEYAGVTHYQYTSAYSGSNQVISNFAYGMRSDIRFYLPDDTGADGNRDIYGNEMHFHFSGDDDVWVLIDGELVLDIGGIHGVESGDINFATGEVSVQDNVVGTADISAGEHTMTVLYLERGASSSNCAIYFNLAPRYSLDIQKEDVLTQELLDGAIFSVYTDAACTAPAELYTSEDAYEQGDAATNIFTVRNGVAHIWGLSPSKTYYIKETGPPRLEGYSIPNGTIQITIEKGGIATYHVEVVDEPSPGFTVHGVSIDEQSQSVYIVVTNAPDAVTDTTTVQVIKKWEDTKDHSSDYIQAYLTVTDEDGTVRRIREVTLSDENEWMYLWTNLPKYDYDTLTEVQYGIEESYESGYYSTVRRITQIEISRTEWAEALTFQNGETYILRTGNGYLSTINDNSDTGYKWVDEQTAKSSPNALWTTTVNGSNVKFTNGVGQTITLYYNNGSPTDFYARIPSPQSADRQEFSYSNRSGGLQIFYRQGNTRYYLTGSMNSSGKFGYSTNQNSSLILNPVCQVTQTDIQETKDWAYQITNTPLAADNETSLSVRKAWDIPTGYDETLYQEFAVTVRLFANGVNTGRTVTLSLKNDWRGVFQGLPYKDDNGNVIAYTVDEVWEKERWSTEYGQIQVIDGSVPTYSTVITNSYTPGGPMLPSTGSAARLVYVLCGAAIMLGTLVYGIGSRRKRERRME